MGEAWFRVLSVSCINSTGTIPQQRHHAVGCHVVGRRARGGPVGWTGCKTNGRRRSVVPTTEARRRPSIRPREIWLIYVCRYCTMETIAWCWRPRGRRRCCLLLSHTSSECDTAMVAASAASPPTSK
ncbi:hypothetical protein VFPFJ_10008 [Purpureocillium lilacinum]|uniref:Uncharacterized protein n=1 Tax=Purpureocillium lilacinum TaxID=33203 RepID=A0A179GP23_PURLI|nr:hypothetical protein VFPFJ_10008 [Purpureocillium lilacinum]OAQ79522.1 hypothetical protein VFPFJ_10008 [Purpureocillium lilacinum]